MRRQHDFYETARWQVDALTDYLPELSGSIWCPCVGDGSLLRRLRENRPDLGPFVTNDLDPARAADWHGDAATAMCWNEMRNHYGQPDWIIENPPFNVEMRILEYAHQVAKCGVVFMSRISFTEPTRDRGNWLFHHPYDKRITLERYSFTGNGSTDSATTDWLVWAKVPIAPPFGVSAFGYRDGVRPMSASSLIGCSLVPQVLAAESHSLNYRAERCRWFYMTSPRFICSGCR